MAQNPTKPHELPLAITEFERRVIDELEQQVGKVAMHGKGLTKAKRITVPRQIVAASRAVLTEHGLVNRNDLISQVVLRPNRLPGANGSIWGRPTHETHAGLTSAYGALCKSISNQTLANRADAIHSFAQQVDRNTPDGISTDRESLVVTALQSLGIDTVIQPNERVNGQPLVLVEEVPLVLPLTPDTNEYLAASNGWTTPYVGADWVDLGKV